MTHWESREEWEREQLGGVSQLVKPQARVRQWVMNFLLNPVFPGCLALPPRAPKTQLIPTIFHSQTVLFWTCEKYPNLKDWQVFHQGLLRLARKLHRCVSQHFLKHYFVPKSNLLQSANPSELDAVAQKVAFFLKNPQVSLP